MSNSDLGTSPPNDGAGVGDGAAGDVGVDPTGGDGGPLGPDMSELPPPSGFGTRPFLFQSDRARLLASIAANDPEATGSSANEAGMPIGFITLCQAAVANRAQYDDVPTWHIAFAGWLTNDNAMLDLARDEALAHVAASPGGINSHSDAYQHSEAEMLNVAAVADLAYARFSAAQLAQVATWVNGTMQNWNTANTTYWPFDDVKNNYWQNGFLATAIAGIATEGFNAQAATWRAQTEAMAAKFKSAGTAPNWNGPMQSEGHYYSTYVRNAIWAMKLYDGVMGTVLLGTSGVVPTQTLDLVMFETRPQLTSFFEVGSEAAISTAPFHQTSLEYWYMLASLAPTSMQARHAKSLLDVATPENFWGRASKGFANFYFNIRSIAAAPLDTKTDRLFVAPTPGAGIIGMRSEDGFKTTARAMLLFANRFNDAPSSSHSNADAPGFQWAQGSDWVVTDPEYFSNSGILAEGGSGVYSDVSNIVTLAGIKYNGAGGFPVINYAEDKRTAVPSHFYTQINAQPYYDAMTTYRRDYVMLDDLRVVVIFDHLVGAPAKTWRLHVPGSPTVAGNTVTYAAGATQTRVRDLYTTGGGAFTTTNLNGTLTQQDCWRIAQADSSNDYRSLKVLDLAGRAATAISQAVAGGLRADITIDGVVRSVTFYDDGTHALIQ